MFSLPRKYEEQPVSYVAQTGVVGWEVLIPIADWSRKTVSVCAATGSLLTILLKDVLSSQSFDCKSFFRCHLSRVPSPVNALQHRRLERALRRAAPGFSEPKITFGERFAVVVAEANQVQEFELGWLSSYDDTFLIAVEAGLTPLEMSQALGAVTLPLDVRAISGLLTAHNSFVVLRAFEEEVQSVFQVICDPSTANSVTMALDEMGVRRAANRVAASMAIGAIPRKEAQKSSDS